MGGKPWTKSEIKILKKNYSSKTINQIMPLLSAHTWGSIAQKAHELKITDRTRGKITWSKKEIKFLRDNFKTMTSYQLAAALQKKRTIVRNKYRELGLAKVKLEMWPREAVKFMKRNYKKVGDVEIAETLQKLYPKKKGWHKDHIAKKRMHLKLNRTKKQIEKILEKHHLPGGKMFTILKNSASANLTDGWIANLITWRNKPLSLEIIKNSPQLIVLKRSQILLNREIKTAQHA